MHKLHLGSMSLNSLLNECLTLQEHNDWKLVHLQGARVEVVVNNEDIFNRADYASVNNDISQIPDLRFLEINGPGDLVIAEAAMKEDRGYFIFDEMLFVENAEQRVYGYGILP